MHHERTDTSYEILLAWLEEKRDKTNDHTDKERLDLLIQVLVGAQRATDDVSDPSDLDKLRELLA